MRKKLKLLWIDMDHIKNPRQRCRTRIVQRNVITLSAIRSFRRLSGMFWTIFPRLVGHYCSHSHLLPKQTLGTPEEKPNTTWEMTWWRTVYECSRNTSALSTCWNVDTVSESQGHINIFLEIKRLLQVTTTLDWGLGWGVNFILRVSLWQEITKTINHMSSLLYVAYVAHKGSTYVV